MAGNGSELSPEQVEDNVMEALTLLSDIAQIEEVCALVKVDVAAVKGKKREMKKLLMKTLCTADEDDDKLADFLAIHSHLKLGKKEEETEEDSDSDDKKGVDGSVKSSLKQEDDARGEETKAAVRTDKMLADLKLSAKLLEDAAKRSSLAHSSSRSSTNDSSTTSLKSSFSADADKMEIRRVRVAKDFKLPGMIGGTSANALTYSSLEFEI